MRGIDRTMIRWGIIGAGAIAHKFAITVQSLKNDGITLKGIASRSPQSSAQFASQYPDCSSYDSMEELLHSPQIDAVYIATPHVSHFKIACAAILASKHVLCEKPMTMNSRQAEALIELSRKHDIFLMEHMWTRFLPVTEKVLSWVREGHIGPIETLHIVHGFRADPRKNARLFHPDLGGGALLDIGIYGVHYTTMLLGFAVEEIEASTKFEESGIDESGTIILSYKGREKKSFIHISIVEDSGNKIEIVGSKGKIVVEPYSRAEKATLYTNNGDMILYEKPHLFTGFEYSIMEASRCIERNFIESPRLPLNVTSDNLKLVDDIRTRMGLVYPCDAHS